MVDLSGLAELGKAAGVAGVAIGMIALVALQIVNRVPSLPRAQQAPMLRFVAKGAFTIAALGIVAYGVASMQIGPKADDCSIANSGTAAGNSINCNREPPPAPNAKP